MHKNIHKVNFLFDYRLYATCAKTCFLWFATTSLEATGVYTYSILTFVARNNANIWVESGVQIKQSNGIQRGKNDKVDSLRIATYASKNQIGARLWRPANPTILEIKNLTSLRDRLMKSQKQLTVPVEEFRQGGDTKPLNYFQEL